MIEPDAPAGARLQLTPAIIGALLVLAASFALSVGFVVANGGMDLPAAAGSGLPVISAAPSPDASSGSVAGASASPTASAAPSAEATRSAAPSVPVPSSPSPTATVTPSAASTPRPSSDRYALLKPCPDAPDCWVYVIRSGDNLVSIARYFGVPLEVVTELNPWTKTTELVAGQDLRLPPPTR